MYYESLNIIQKLITKKMYLKKINIFFLTVQLF